jgi:hypothetical protein
MCRKLCASHSRLTSTGERRETQCTGRALPPLPHCITAVSAIRWTSAMLSASTSRREPSAGRRGASLDYRVTRGYLEVAVDEPAGGNGCRLAFFSPKREVTKRVRIPPGRCLPGGPARAPPHDAPRRMRPAPLTRGPLNRPFLRAEPARAAFFKVLPRSGGLVKRWKPQPPVTSVTSPTALPTREPQRGSRTGRQPRVRLTAGARES